MRRIQYVYYAYQAPPRFRWEIQFSEKYEQAYLFSSEEVAEFNARQIEYVFEVGFNVPREKINIKIIEVT